VSADGGVPSPPIKVGGVEVPVPAGAQLGIEAGGNYGEEGPTQGIHRGSTYILFNNKGIIQAKVAPEDEADFQPTMNALQTITDQH
jgi:hypothetical protein